MNTERTHRRFLMELKEVRKGMETSARDNFPDRVRFNWGFHDGSAEAERASVRDMDQHPDKAYANGYVRGVLAWKNLGYRPESSDNAWNAMQQLPPLVETKTMPEKTLWTRLSQAAGHPWDGRPGFDTLEFEADTKEESDSFYAKAVTEFWKSWLVGYTEDRKKFGGVLYKPSGINTEWDDSPKNPHPGIYAPNAKVET